MRSLPGATLLALAALGTVFQIWWFGRTCFNEIDYDGMSYIGIARHIHQREFYQSINAFRSPAISWIIAALSLHGNYTHLGKIVNVGAFVLTLAVTYVLTLRLWRSSLAASIATLLLALSRGLAAIAIEIVTPDFLFAALILVYFAFLLRCLRGGRWKDWFWVGVFHGVAFLVKAFGLPWLAVSSATAVLVSTGSWKARVTRLGVAGIIPVVIVAGWSTVLHAKYGTFTTGTQFKTNLLQWTLRAYREHRESTYSVLDDTSKEVDQYLVADPMPPGSWAWRYRINTTELIPQIIQAEVHNVPLVIKEILILATPGGLLAFVCALVVMFRQKRKYSVEWRFGIVVAVATLALIGAYSMLVFDSRYLFPLIPLIVAVSAVVLAGKEDFRRWTAPCLALVLLGVISSTVYRSSPFRTLTRDFQISCYDAGNRLKEHSSLRLISIGSGPFPEHGVGWEAGYKAAYFGGSWLIATSSRLPEADQRSSVVADIYHARPDAILIWGKHDDPRRVLLIRELMVRPVVSTEGRISDPVLGDVGTIIFQSPLTRGTAPTVN